MVWHQDRGPLSGREHGYGLEPEDRFRFPAKTHAKATGKEAAVLTNLYSKRSTSGVGLEDVSVSKALTN